MSGEARAAVAVGKDRIEIQRFPRPRLGPKDLLVRVALCGVCGSDPHIMRGDWGTPYPAAIGILARGGLPFERLVTQSYPLAEAATALQASVERRGDNIKVVIDPQA